MKKRNCAWILAALICASLFAWVQQAQAGSAETVEFERGASWYLVVDNLVNGRVGLGKVTVPVEVYMVMLLKNAAEGPSAMGQYTGTSYYEFKVSADELLVDGKSYWSGFTNTYSFAYTVDFTLNQLGENVAYTEYSGEGTIDYVDLQEVSVVSKIDSSVGVDITETSSMQMRVKIHAFPGSGDAKGLDVTVEFTDPEMAIFGLPPFIGKLFSANEFGQQEFEALEEKLDDQINLGKPQ